MTLSTPANTPRTSILLLPQPRQSVAPLGTTSPSCKRFPHRLCVAVKFGVCVCECGKVTALKASAYHRLEPPVPRCMDFNRFVLRQWCFGRLQVARAPRSAYVGITFCCSFALVLTLRVFIRQILFYAAKLWHTAEQQGQVCTPCSSVLRFVAERQSPLLLRQSAHNAILWQCKI